MDEIETKCLDFRAERPELCEGPEGLRPPRPHHLDTADRIPSFSNALPT